MDKKYIPEFKNLPYSNLVFDRFFKNPYGLAGRLSNIFDSVSQINTMCGEQNFDIFVGEDMLQAVSAYAGVNFITKYDNNGKSQYCYGTMHDGLANQNPTLINFAVQQGKGQSVVVTYSTYAPHNLGEVSSCWVEIISEDGHTFMENSLIKDIDNNYFVAKSEIGRYEGGTSYSQITRVEGEEALQISTDKKDLLDFAGALARVSEARPAINGVEILGYQQREFQEHIDSVNSALSDICAQNFEK